MMKLFCPPHLYYDEFLYKILDKNRECFVTISKINQGEDINFKCIKGAMRLKNTFKFFNVDKFYDMGYSKFKLINYNGINLAEYYKNIRIF